MKNKTIVIAVVLCLAVIGLLTVFRSTDSPSPSSSDSAPTANQELAIPAQQLAIGTGSSGGVYYPIGAGLAEVISSHVEPLNVTSEITGGSVENVRLVGEGEIDIAFCNSDNLAFGLAGTAPYTESYDLNTICSIIPSVLHIVTLQNTDVKSIEDLKGKKVAVGPAGGSSITTFEVALTAHGMTMSDITPTYVGYDDGISQLKDAQVDAALVMTGHPAAAVLTLSATDKVVLIDIAQDKLDAIREAAPYYTPVTIPKDMYGMDKDAITICVKNIVFCKPGLSEDTVYAITKAIFDNLDEFKTYHSGLTSLSAADMADAGEYKRHPGAQRYFDEAGL